MRQRVKLKDAPVAEVVARALAGLFALALIWYGAMLILLALKFSPSTVNALSGYRDAYDYLSGLAPGDIDATTRLIAAIAGLVCAGLFGYLAWRSLPRPHLTRTALALRDDDKGRVEVQARVIERAAELAAGQASSVVAARARYAQDGLQLDVGVSRAAELTATLTDAQERAREALSRHQLPELPVSVTLAHFDRKTRRELK